MNLSTNSTKFLVIILYMLKYVLLYLMKYCIVLCCINGVVIAAQCTATILRSIVLPEFRY